MQELDYFKIALGGKVILLKMLKKIKGKTKGEFVLPTGRETTSSISKNCHSCFDFSEAMIITMCVTFSFFYFQNNARIFQGAEFSIFSLPKSICKILLFELQISYYLLDPFRSQGWQSKYTANLKTGQKKWEFVEE